MKAYNAKEAARYRKKAALRRQQTLGVGDPPPQPAASAAGALRSSARVKAAANQEEAARKREAGRLRKARSRQKQALAAATAAAAGATLDLVSPPGLEVPATGGPASHKRVAPSTARRHGLNIMGAIMKVPRAVAGAALRVAMGRSEMKPILEEGGLLDTKAQAVAALAMRGISTARAAATGPSDIQRRVRTCLDGATMEAGIKKQRLGAETYRRVGITPACQAKGLERK